MTATNGGPYSIGSTLWPGLSKLAEECGELLQVIGKVIGTGGAVDHWDGTHLPDALYDELSDVLAAIEFFIDANEMSWVRIGTRQALKVERFEQWHGEAR